MTEADAERWDEKYSRVERRPWDIDGPQSVVVELAEAGKLNGRVLDLGCGTGENAILVAQHGAEVVGVDISSVAIEKAAQKARDRGVAVRFEVADALRLDRLDETFDVVIDSGLFHTFAAPDSRSLYRSSLANVIRPDGLVYLTCISDLQTGDWGPRRVGQAEIQETFIGRGWEIEELRECERERRVNSPAKAWLVTIRRIA
jgi:2-polyprenyl-3-methyl-5-hydroxy-6-metoxy-1,4-benzoquinol methylase